MDFLSRYGFHIGRVIVASLFILAGFNKIANFDAIAAQMNSVGLKPTALLLPATIALELGGGLIVAWGKRLAMPTALVFTLYTLVINFLFHPFWAFEGERGMLELSLFFKNVTIMGALIFIASVIARDEQRKTQ